MSSRTIRDLAFLLIGLGVGIFVATDEEPEHLRTARIAGESLATLERCK